MSVCRYWWGRGGLWCAVALSLFAPELAHAQDFFNLSPKPLSKAHAQWDERAGCEKCHKLGGGVTAQLCLDCHDHQPLAQKIAQNKGLHAKHKGKACTTCHTEHKGRAKNITSWDKVGGRRKFDHKLTGFVLDGRHKEVACTKCHLKKLDSGRTSFLGVRDTCDGCHGNTHNFTNKTLKKDCESCHAKGGGRAAKMTAAQLPFAHGDKTGTALDGLHSKATCADCHKGLKMPMKRKRTCVGCHKQPHGRTFKKSKCADCHAVDKKFARSSFNHDKTKFKLRGKHDLKSCSKCHKSLKKDPKSTCSGCHGRTHKKRFEGILCKSCHGIDGAKDRFNHDKNTELALTGKHAELTCRDCHRGTKPWKFEKHETAACRDCHTHKDAHKGEFDDKKCGQCHKEGGTTDLVFDHNKDSQFPLTGLHVNLDCAKCHTGSQFRIGKLECRECHEDSHDGQLGEDCAKCHETSVVFDKIDFDHDRLSQFKLVGLHKEAKCEGCHPKKNYRLGEMNCIDCHKEDDPHLSALGEDCAKCHEPLPKASKFEHNVLTQFPLTGRHKETDCSYCHEKRETPRPPQPVGWATPAPELVVDQQFPVAGRECAKCHLDVHAGAYGVACESCHSTKSFAEVQRAVHDTGAFRLQGTHDRLACQRCHQPEKELSGLGSYCVGCHLNDDVHQNALGPRCGDCHAQFDWRPARFNHAVVGFSLAGAHRTADCRDCHQGGLYAGTPRDCQRCHIQNAATVQNPPHTPVMNSCENCHTPIAFVPARRYHPWYALEGQHAAADCISCHTGGTYVGTPRDCAGCHMPEYDSPNTKPNHVQAGMSTDCASCHRPIAWQGARYVHQTFVRRGLHRSTDCASCHPGDDYRAAFGGQVTDFECASCHGPTGPIASWPADHSAEGYPTTCALCHTELAWTPARGPR